MDPNAPKKTNVEKYDIYFQDDAKRYMWNYEAYEQFHSMSNQEVGGSGSGIKRTRTYISREREEAEQRLLDGDDETPPKYRKKTLGEGYDATGRASIGPNLKCTSSILQLAYGTSPDAFDEYLQIAERFSRECLDNFTKRLYILYVEEYFRRPSLEDIEKTYALHEKNMDSRECSGVLIVCIGTGKIAQKLYMVNSKKGS
ncbi:hypothetical protein Tco_1464831 [Tanacetum coccineum]